MRPIIMLSYDDGKMDCELDMARIVFIAFLPFIIIAAAFIIRGIVICYKKKKERKRSGNHFSM